MLPRTAQLKITSSLFLQSMGAHRKPRWLPVAKSKIYRIPKRPDTPLEEKLELKRLNDNYHTQMRAVRRFLHEDMIREKSTLESDTSEMSVRLEAEEWNKCVKINEAWNAKVACEREERRMRELAEMEEYAFARMEAKDKEKGERIEKASEEIRKQKELSKTFITPETIDEAIDHALANPMDYNYAIDLKGNVYPGTNTPASVPEQKRSKAIS